MELCHSRSFDGINDAMTECHHLSLCMPAACSGTIDAICYKLYLLTCMQLYKKAHDGASKHEFQATEYRQSKAFVMSIIYSIKISVSACMDVLHN